VVKSREQFKFWWAPCNYISGTAEARVVKFCTQFQHKNDKSPLKGAW